MVGEGVGKDKSLQQLKLCFNYITSYEKLLIHDWTKKKLLKC